MFKCSSREFQVGEFLGLQLAKHFEEYVMALQKTKQNKRTTTKTNRISSQYDVLYNREVPKGQTVAHSKGEQLV